MPLLSGKIYVSMDDTSKLFARSGMRYGVHIENTGTSFPEHPSQQH